jgi:hypothetical protein
MKSMMDYMEEPLEAMVSEEGVPEEVLSLDLTSVELPPNGRYVMVVNKAVVGRAKTSGKKMLTLTLVVEEPDRYRGVVVFDHLMFEGPGTWRTKSALDALGLPYQGITPRNFEGKYVKVELRQENDPTYGDRVRVARYIR